MAWTVTRTQTVFGDQRTVLLKCTADAATQTIETGLKVVLGLESHLLASMASITGRKVFPNSNASGVSSMGVLGCSGFAIGDDIYITVFGR